jgi:phosphotransferase system enzyme I (PtsI)
VLVGLGVTSLSMAPASVPDVRKALAGNTLADCQRIAAAVRQANSPQEARANAAKVNRSE